MNAWIKEIVEQISISSVLQQSDLDSGKRLALICVDNAVEVALKFYASYHGLVNEPNLGSQQGFYLALDEVRKENKIDDTEKKDIRKFHNIRNDLYHRANLTTVKDGVINDYGKLAKTLLERLFDFQISEAEWVRLGNDARRSLTKGKIEVRASVEYELRDLNGTQLVRMKTSVGKIKNTESIQLVIHGFVMNYAKPPNKEELSKSLMISGRDVSANVLDARLSELRGRGYLERGILKLKGKTIKKLEKKFVF